jgi:hypothetical protein
MSTWASAFIEKPDNSKKEKKTWEFMGALLALGIPLEEP